MRKNKLLQGGFTDKNQYSAVAQEFQLRTNVLRPSVFRGSLCTCALLCGLLLIFWGREKQKLGLQDALMDIAAGAESRKQLGNVIRAAGFHGDVYSSVAQVDAVVCTVI